jgi:hypothetical protein
MRVEICRGLKNWTTGGESGMVRLKKIEVPKEKDF